MPSRSAASTAPGAAGGCTSYALNDVELAITALLDDDTAAGASDNDTRDHLPAIVPTLNDLTELGDPCLRW